MKQMPSSFNQAVGARKTDKSPEEYRFATVSRKERICLIDACIIQTEMASNVQQRRAARRRPIS